MTMKTRRALCAAAALGAVALASGATWAQGADAAADFPSRPIKVIVPYPPGGSTDPAARLLAADMAPHLGQPVVVENKPGASGAIGTEFVAHAPADGYTVLFHTSVIATDPTFKKNAPYDVKRDLAPVTLAVTGPYLMVVNPSLPVHNVAELIAYAKAHPGKLNYGSAGQTSSGHLIGELFKKAAGIDMVHVAYKGGGPSIVGLMSNEVQLVFDTLSGSKSLAESGKLRAIAVTSPQRSPVMPDVPTASESGLKDFSAVYWLGAFVPAKTPKPVVDKLYRAFKQSLDNPKVQERMLLQGNVTQGLPPDQFKQVLDKDIERYRDIIESADIRAN